MLRAHAVVALLAGAALAGCGPGALGDDAPRVERSSQAIVGGTATSGDPQVVAVTVGNGRQFEAFCTGTLIGPKTVLTAAHCIEAYGAQYDYYVTFGGDTARPTSSVRVVGQTADPSYTGRGYDFGLLQLQSAVVGVTPATLNTQAVGGAWVGQSIRHVGYGITSSAGNGAGVKREVTYTLRTVSALTIESGASGKQTCSGDSGGPAFMVPPGGSGEALVGVVSYGDQNCTQYGYDGRVDVAVPWIRQTMAAWEQPTCELDGACKAGCTPVDQDCACLADGVCSAQCLDPARDPDCPKDCAANGVCSVEPCPNPDVDCLDDGAVCGSAMQCPARLCVSDPQNPDTYCSRPCAASADCAQGLFCGPDGFCIHQQRFERGHLDVCLASEDYCLAGDVCTGPQGGISRCVKPCSSAADCAGIGACEGGFDGTRYCRPTGVRFLPTVLPAAPSVDGPAATGCTSVGGLPGVWLGVLGLVGALRRHRRRSH